MSDSKLTIVERQVNDIMILVLTGEILIDDGDLLYGRRIDDVLARGHLKVLVDLAGVTYIGSSGMGMIAATLNRVRARGGDLKLLHVSSKSQRLLSLFRLRTLFEIFDDEAIALRSFEFRPDAT